MGIEDTVADLTLKTRPRNRRVSSKGVLLAEERLLTGSLAPRTPELPVEGVESLLLGLQLILVSFKELESDLRVHLFERGHGSSVSLVQAAR